LLEETDPSELATMLDLNVYTVQETVKAFEADGAIVSRLVGRTRRVELNPRYFAREELAALLWKLGERDVDLQKALSTKRRRPRRTGKPLR
jgi:hypothetical protein